MKGSFLLDPKRLGGVVLAVAYIGDTDVYGFCSVNFGKSFELSTKRCKLILHTELVGNFWTPSIV